MVSTGGEARSHPCLKLLAASLLWPPWVLDQQVAALPAASPRHRPEWGVGTLAPGGRDDLSLRTVLTLQPCCQVDSQIV